MEQKIAALLAIGFIAILSPGPDFVVILKNSVHGRRAAFLAASGVLVGFLVQVVACVFGVSVILTESPRVYRVLQLAGAAYLIYLGVKALLHSRTRPVTAEPLPTSATSPFREGLLNNLLNPKCTLFLFSVFTQFCDATTPVTERIAYGGALFMESILYWYGFAALLGQKHIQAQVVRIGRIADPVLGAVLILLGASILFSSR